MLGTSELSLQQKCFLSVKLFIEYKLFRCSLALLYLHVHNFPKFAEFKMKTTFSVTLLAVLCTNTVN